MKTLHDADKSQKIQDAVKTSKAALDESAVIRKAIDEAQAGDEKAALVARLRELNEFINQQAHSALNAAYPG